MTVKNLKYLWLGHLYRAGDIDVWIAINPENAKKVVEAIKEFGFNDPDLSEDIFLKEDKVIRKVASRSEEAETTAFYYIGSVIKQHLILFLARLGLTFVPAETTIDGAWRKAGALLKFIGKIEFSVQIWRVGSTAPINPDQFEDVVIIEEQALAVYLNLGNGFFSATPNVRLQLQAIAQDLHLVRLRLKLENAICRTPVFPSKNRIKVHYRSSPFHRP